MKGQLIIVDEVDSTNLAVRKQFSMLPDGSLFCALTQSAGRGRLNRRWVTPPGSAICASGVFKEIAAPFHAGAIIALAALEMISGKLGDERAYFKWPNDIYIGNRKLAGILSEGIFEKGQLTGVISGIGININQSQDELELLDNAAASLFSESGKKFDLSAMYGELFEHFSVMYKLYRKDPENIIRKWQRANRLLGRILEAVRPDGTRIRGIFSEILPDGAMLIHCDGKDHRFDCGDIRIDPAALPAYNSGKSE